MNVSCFNSPQLSVPRLAFVDALRGWAILAVIAGHTAQYFHPESDVVTTLAAAGGRGVQLFFVVSAFSLMLSLHIKAPSESRWLASYFIRRFFRIAPLFYAFIALYALIPEARQFWVGHPTSIETIMLGLLFLNGWHPLSVNSVVPGGWSIVAEAAFYVLLPLWFVSVNSISKGLNITLAAVIAGLGISWLARLPFLNDVPIQQIRDFTFVWLPAQASVFCVGGLLFMFLKKSILPCAKAPDREALSHKQAERIALSILLFGLLLILAMSFGSGYRYLPGQFLYAVAFALVAFALSHRQSSILVNRVTCFIGKVSYSAYFWHFVVIWVLSTFPIATTFKLTYTAALLLATSITLALSQLTWMLIERPFIQFGAHLVSKLNQQNVPPIHES